MARSADSAANRQFAFDIPRLTKIVALYTQQFGPFFAATDNNTRHEFRQFCPSKLQFHLRTNFGNGIFSPELGPRLCNTCHSILNFRSYLPDMLPQVCEMNFFPTCGSDKIERSKRAPWNRGIAIAMILEYTKRTSR